VENWNLFLGSEETNLRPFVILKIFDNKAPLRIRIMIKNLPALLRISAIALTLTLGWSVQTESARDPIADENLPNPTLAKMFDRPKKLFKSYHDVIRKLGKPKSVNVTTEPNRHDLTTSDTIRTLTHPGLMVVVYQVSKIRRNSSSYSH
jgi:hypothetical protein